MPRRVKIADRVLFNDEILKILKKFDAYARCEGAKGGEPSVAHFHSLYGKELGFSYRSLVRWLSLRRRYGNADKTDVDGRRRR
jgi:hypothetical protein